MDFFDRTGLEKLIPSLLRKPVTTVSRRTFIQVTALGGAGFLVACGQRDEPAADAAAAEPLSPPAADAGRVTLNAFVEIRSDDTVTAVIKHLDKGQGITTGLATLVAEELDAEWDQMRWRFAPADVEKYANLGFGQQLTGGSSSISNSFVQYRQAGAAARAMLVAAAAKRWGVPAGEITVERGVLRHAGGQQASFGALAADAAGEAPPAEPALKQPGDFRLIGTAVPRIDSDEKTDGTARYTIDVDLPGMKHAVIQHPPRFGAVPKSFDADAALAMPGVHEVVQVPHGVAVIADGYWEALQARDKLEIEWDETNAETRGTEQLMEAYRALAGTTGAVARQQGDADGALASAVTVLEREYTFPYLAHAAMEPLNCVVDLREDGCDIWTGSQWPTMDQGVAARLTGLDPAAIRIHTLFAGGSFGRRAVPDSDYVAEAVSVARAMQEKAPIRLQWSREDDLRAGRYRPMYFQKLAGALDAEGNIVGWRQTIVGQSIFAGSVLADFVKDGVDPSAVEGAAGLPYAIPNLHVDVHLAPVGVPVLWWRSVGHTQNAFSTETFLDVLAAEGGHDPFELRRRLLAGHPRLLGVLELAADRAGWGSPLPAGRGRGIAVHESFNTFVAEVAEVTVHDDGSYQVDRVVCAIDCGIAVNPDVIRAQMEGGIGFGLGAVMREKVTLTEGRVDQRNFFDYFPLRIDDMPAVEVHSVPSTEPPTGVGEPGVPPIGPAVANAIRAATGTDITELPIGDKLPV